MTQTQKIYTVGLWGLAVVAMIGIIASGMWRDMPKESAGQDHLPELFFAPEFSLINQNGQNMGSKDLQGKVWIADFIFTLCAGPCPMMTAKMANLQKEIQNDQVRLVSFSVDPQRDTPAVLKEYAARFEADESRWHFLTGEEAAIYDVAAGMKIAAKPAEGETPILHSTRFLLVDRGGGVRGVYDSADAGAMKKLAADASALAAEPRGQTP